MLVLLCHDIIKDMPNYFVIFQNVPLWMFKTFLFVKHVYQKVSFTRIFRKFRDWDVKRYITICDIQGSV